MKVVILAGGYGSRLSEETSVRPKPMIEIGGKPILWHIMSIYAHYGYTNFIIACGFKNEIIKEYFFNFYIHNSDLMIDLKDGCQKIIHSNTPNWKVSVIDTGLHSMTGGRILKLKPNLGEGAFMVTYGDGVGNINIQELVDFHHSHGKIATVTAVRPTARFGSLVIEKNNSVCTVLEKSQMKEGWINGGFFVFNQDIFEYLKEDDTILERDPLESLARDRQLMAYYHSGFWQPMDTIREKKLLEDLWNEGQAPWKIWN